MSLPNTPFLVKGALIYFGAPMLIPVPNIIVFQYNPETMTRTLTPWQPPGVVRPEGRGGQAGESDACAEARADARTTPPLSQPFDPEEKFSLALEFDATDALETPERHPVAVVAGVADRLAAIETLLFPPGDSLLGGLMGSVSASVSVSAGGLQVGASAGAGAQQLERKDAPVVLFFWGPGRILPVRIETLSIEEQQYSPMLYPTRAKATIGLRVLALKDLEQLEGDAGKSATVSLAKGCYKYTQGQKMGLATANLVNAAESIVMIPL